MNTKSILISFSLVLFTCFIGLVLFESFKMPIEISIILSVSVIGILELTPIVLKRYKNRQNEYDILLENISPADGFGTPIAAGVFTVIAVFWVILFLYSLDLLSLIIAVFWSLASLNAFINGTKFQKNGLMISSDFIEWEKIESFSWAHKNNSKHYVLLLKYKKQIAFIDFGVVSFKLKVPMENKNAIESIFERCLPGKLEADSSA